MDYAGNGKINFTEFLAATVDVEQFLTNEKIEAIFDAFDVSNDGIISTDDFKVAFSKFGREISAEDIHEIIKAHDNDGAQGISLDEFTVMLRDGVCESAGHHV